MTNKIVAVVEVNDDGEIGTEDLNQKVQWLSMPQETYDNIVNFLEHPETGVRLERPKRKAK